MKTLWFIEQPRITDYESVLYEIDLYIMAEALIEVVKTSYI